MGAFKVLPATLREKSEEVEAWRKAGKLNK
jgi:hypothetical protein